MTTDLTWPKRPPGQNFMGAYHHATPPLLKEIWMTTDLTWPKRPPQSKFHGCIPSCYTSFTKGNFDDYRFDLTKKTPPVKISWVHTIMLHLYQRKFWWLQIWLDQKTPQAKISQVHTITLHIPATGNPDTTKTMCYRSASQCWKAFLVVLKNIHLFVNAQCQY